MPVAGIDLGSQTTKVVILEADRILASVTLQTGATAESEARQAMEEALRQAHLKLEDLQGVCGRRRALHRAHRRSPGAAPL